MQFRLVLPLALTVALALPSPSALGEETWIQWRGPSRDGVLPGADWPKDLASLELLWRVDLGKGYPSPIVAADRVFVAETVDGDTEAVRALDRRTGRELWRASWPGKGSVPFFAAKNGDWIRSTPAFDGQTLFVGGMEEVLVALDGESGEELWRVDFPERFGTRIPDFGFASSPLVDGDAIYVQAANSLVKLDKKSGATLWRTLAGSGDMGSSGAFSSPVLATLAGQRQVVVQTRLALHGVDPHNGEVLWSQEVPHFRGMNILTPQVFGDAVFTSSYRNSSFLYRIERAEFGKDFEVSQAWSHKAQGYMSSPVVLEDHAYLHLGNGRLTCLNLRTGESLWTTKPMGKYWSMVTDGTKILALDDGGDLRLMKADPRGFQLLDSREISDSSTWGHLAVAGEEIYVRELEAIAAYRWKSSPEAAGPPRQETTR